MNYLDFFASVIGSITSLAWPAAVVAAVWLFSGEIRPLLPRLKLKHKDTEISFRLDEAEKTIEHLPAPISPPTPPETPEEKTRFEQLARLSPNSAIVELRREIEGEVRALADATGMPGVDRTPIRHSVRLLRDKGVIGPEASALLDDLLAVGNIAAHSNEREFRADEALRYREYTDRLIELLNESHINVLLSGAKDTTERSPKP